MGKLCTEHRCIHIHICKHFKGHGIVFYLW